MSDGGADRDDRDVCSQDGSEHLHLRRERRKRDAVHTPLQRVGKEVPLLLLVTVSAAHEQLVTTRQQPVLHPARESRVVGVGDVGDDQRHHVRSIGSQRASERVRSVVELTDSPFDANPRNLCPGRFPDKACETVVMLTPAWRATSKIVTSFIVIATDGCV
jgi:hypothetical protein